MIPAFDTDLDLAFLAADDGEDIAEILSIACEIFDTRGATFEQGDAL